jgi:hypothetical protein
MLSVTRDTDLSMLQRKVEERLVGIHGVRIVGSGTLEEDDFDHCAGTPYVAIAAHSVQSADFAEAALADIGGIPETRWARGWDKRSGELTLSLFPSVDLD